MGCRTFDKKMLSYFSFTETEAKRAREKGGDDQYSSSLNFDSNEIPKYCPGEFIALKRNHHYTCAEGTCDSWNSSYGFNSNYKDEELNVLPHFEFIITSKLRYRPFITKLQKMITTVYDWKYEMRIDDLSYKENLMKQREMISKCESTTYEIHSLLREYIERERCVDTGMVILSLSLYKLTLQEMTGCKGDDTKSWWMYLKTTVPSKYISCVEVLVDLVKPFLLG